MALLQPHEWPLLAVALGQLVVATLWLLARCRSRVVRRGHVTFHPAHRVWLRKAGLREPEDFLNLEAVIVSGHPGRQVVRLTLGSAESPRVVYLKREQESWLSRLGNFLAGFGWVARPIREAQMLEALQRDGLPGPCWLAAGEDGLGGAFLMVEEVAGAIPLTRALEALAIRRQIAARLGRLLARLHEAGFFHHDLYAKHVLVGPDGAVHLLDWQRARRGAWGRRAARIRDLAALHATVPEHLAGPRERLALLRAYAGPDTSPEMLRRLAHDVQKETQRLLKRRHIREKRQPPTVTAQTWIRLDGQALCITPALAELYPGEPPAWLSLDQKPLPPHGAESRRWLSLPRQRQALLMRRRGWPGLASLVRAWLGGVPLVSRHQRRATLLWRLERHGVAAPRVLACGQRQLSPWCVDSFLLLEPLSATTNLIAWLAGQTSPQRMALLEQMGQLLARLHEACCYLDAHGLSALSVRREGTENLPVVADVEGVVPLRRPSSSRARADLARLRRLLDAAGATEAEWSCVGRGYREVSIALFPSPLWGKHPPSAKEDRAVLERTSLWHRLVCGCWRLIARPDWCELAGPDWPARIMDVPVTDRFFAKQGRSTGRLVLQTSADAPARLVVYLKRHYRLSWWRGLLAALWPSGDWSPAMQEYNHLEWARQQGVPVPATAAVGEWIGPAGRLCSFLAVEELTGMLPLHEAILLAQERLSPVDFRRWKRGLVAELARLARLLHDRRHFHKDLYLCHFFIRHDDTTRLLAPGDWRGRIFLIDLHRLGHHRWTWWRWQSKDLAQLLYSSAVPGVDLRDQVAFWKHYRGLDRRPVWRWLRQAILFKWRRYCRHNARKRMRGGRDLP